MLGVGNFVYSLDDLVCFYLLDSVEDVFVC